MPRCNITLTVIKSEIPLSPFALSVGRKTVGFETEVEGFRRNDLSTLRLRRIRAYAQGER
jgi:hypothetical protein